MIHVERLLEKYFADIRHVETERHWFLGAYAIVIAGTLAFLAQDEQRINAVIAFGSLTVLSVIGLLYTCRAAFVLNKLQKEAKEIVCTWEANRETDDVEWIKKRWVWPHMRDKKKEESEKKYGKMERFLKALCGKTREFFKLIVSIVWNLPPTFTFINIVVYVFAIMLFVSLLVLNATKLWL